MEAIRIPLADGKSHTERELALIADRAALAGGAERIAYDSTVHPNLLMTDIGARRRGYVADGGRGFSYGTVNPEKRAIVEAAVRAVDAGLTYCRPGITASDLNTAIQKALVISGFEQFSSEAHRHGTGHCTGMDPEEGPWIGPGNRTVLRENMVFTLEATITVPGDGGLQTERIVCVSATGVNPLDVYPMELYR
ncbi:hypothetical protein LTR16_002598 [Cryomyces antarcticus]|uniref:Peptidase M24 domain-containing protein n=1 Tax=Cryomyces antarcticus TaxID=329879 RepID=A0ABR0M085_9PEZI|nr:hypothetical protein LTR16_002598 [Cryomyces antarcticus]